MGKFKVGQVITCSFPFSDLTGKKIRPALIVAIVDFDNLILCQITSKKYSSSDPVKLTKTDFRKGSLPIESFIRTDKIFTADPSMINNIYGHLSNEKIQETLTKIRALFS